MKFILTLKIFIENPIFLYQIFNRWNLFRFKIIK